MRKQTVISLSDFRHVSIECPHCHTRVILDMGKPSGFATQHGSFSPVKCPGCNADYDSSITPGINALQRAFAGLAAMATHITFIGEQEADPGRQE